MPQSVEIHWERKTVPRISVPGIYSAADISCSSDRTNSEIYTNPIYQFQEAFYYRFKGDNLRADGLYRIAATEASRMFTAMITDEVANYDGLTRGDYGTLAVIGFVNVGAIKELEKLSAKVLADPLLSDTSRARVIKALGQYQYDELAKHK